MVQHSLASLTCLFLLITKHNFKIASDQKQETQIFHFLKSYLFLLRANLLFSIIQSLFFHASFTFFVLIII